MIRTAPSEQYARDNGHGKLVGGVSYANLPDGVQPPQHQAARSASQVAAALGLTRSAVSDTEHRALRKLREGLLQDPVVCKLLEEMGLL